MSKVLIVDDSPVDRRLAGKLLEKRGEDGEPTGITVVSAENGRQALEVIAREHPDAVVTDLQMPEMNGLDLVMQIRARHPLLPVILMTAPWKRGVGRPGPQERGGELRAQTRVGPGPTRDR